MDVAKAVAVAAVDVAKAVVAVVAADVVKAVAAVVVRSAFCHSWLCAVIEH